MLVHVVCPHPLLTPQNTHLHATVHTHTHAHAHRYVGRLKSNGKVFDKTDKKPFAFRLGEWVTVCTDF